VKYPPEEARCVFIDGPVAVYVKHAPPHDIRRAHDRLVRLVSCMCTELELAEKRKTYPLRIPLPQTGQEFP